MRASIAFTSHRLGINCGSSPFRDVLEHAGFRMTEDMIFGRGSGLNLAYHHGDEVVPDQHWRARLTIVTGRSIAPYQEAASVLGVQLYARRCLGNAEALRHLQDHLDRGFPVVCEIDREEMLPLVAQENLLTVVLHRPLPTSGVLRTRGKVLGLYDLRRFAQSTLVTQGEDDAGTLIAETEWTIFHTVDVVNGGASPPRRRTVRSPARPPDFTMRFPTSANQAALYRLNGDENPLHIDPAFAAVAGFPRPILHGLCMYGMACLAMVRSGVATDQIRSMDGQFRAPVFPDEVLVVELWREGAQMHVRAHAEQRSDDPALAYGYAELG